MEHLTLITLAAAINADTPPDEIQVRTIFDLLAIHERRILDFLPQGFSVSHGGIYAPCGHPLCNADYIATEGA